MGISLTEQGYGFNNLSFKFNFKYLLNPILYIINKLKKKQINMYKQYIEFGENYNGLDYQMVLVFDEIDKNEAIKQMEEESKREAGRR